MNKTSYFSTIVGVIVNFLLFCMKLFAGILSGSIAIVSDALNNFNDSITSGISFFGFKYSNKLPDKEHPYGHKRVEYITGLIVGVLIIFVAFNLFSESISSIIKNDELNITLLTLILLSVSLFFKLVLSLYFYLCYKKTKSVILKANSIDSLTDSIGTIFIIISSTISMYYTIPFSMDGILGLLLSGLIFFSGFSIIKEELTPLISEKPDKELIDIIYLLINRYKSVIKGTHDLKYHSYGKDKVFISIHCEIDYKTDIILAHEVIDKIERDAINKYGIDLTIHLDPINYDDSLTNCLKDLVVDLLHSKDTRFKVHDFRVVHGRDHDNLIFDIEVPINYSSNEDLLSYLKDELLKKGYKTNLLVSFDTVYY